ncbi:GIY-YIG nuclease family protein [Thalassotalea sediminis]|uniref:GIY-YIG nuclease family protein n=1 Tax=Thalassotalea sediminis TaxID=1759089 RepID=UPI0025722B06|nr:GIY-YIG nuclease family protein [Thalassotalea sediminis]
MTVPSLWYVYLVRCADNSLYAGVTTDISRRINEHNHTNKGAKYTRVRRPVSLAYVEHAANRQAACQREYSLRKLPKKKKELLVCQYQNNNTVQL